MPRRSIVFTHADRAAEHFAPRWPGARRSEQEAEPSGIPREGGGRVRPPERERRGGARAPRGAVRRYVRAVLAEENVEPVDLPAVVRFWPRLLRAAEPAFAAEGDRLRCRLTLATRIVEMTPAAAPVFHNYRERPRWLAWLALGWLLAVEAVFLPFRWVATRLRPRRR